MHCRDKLFITTNKLEVNLGHVAESFTIGNPVSNVAIEAMLVILRNELKGTGRKILSLNNIVSKDHCNNEYQSINRSTLSTSELTNSFLHTYDKISSTQ